MSLFYNFDIKKNNKMRKYQNIFKKDFNKSSFILKRFIEHGSYLFSIKCMDLFLK